MGTLLHLNPISMNIFDRPPSSTWEALPLTGNAQLLVWAWFKPAAAPHGLFLRIPDETLASRATSQPLTLRSMTEGLGIDPRHVALASVYGAPFSGLDGKNPAWDIVLQPPPVGYDPTIALFLAGVSGALAPPSTAPYPATAPGYSAASYSAGATPAAAIGGILARLDTIWNAVIQIELQLAAAGKQLSGTLSRLNSLNRDLSFEESRFADQLDHKEWNEARRWLRDIANRVSRVLKDHHVGTTSIAGRRGWFESIYKQHIVPRREFENMEQAERDFDAYRKTIQTLLNAMNAVQSAAAQDGERRAQVVLARIATKVRSARSKRG
jgi:hypothetical protein